MKRYTVLSLTVIFFLLGSCQSVNTINHQTPPDNISDENPGTKIVLFYNRDTEDLEKEYYEALFDFTDAYPKKDIEIELVQSDKYDDLSQRYEVIQCPTLILIQGEKVQLRIEGDKKREYIFKHLSEVIESKVSFALKENSAIAEPLAKAEQ
jgi:hypothetical protein